MNMQMIFDGALALLLMAAILLALRVNARLAAFRDNRDALAQLVVQLTTAVNQAHAGIGQLKAATQTAERTLDDRLQRVRLLTDELGVMAQAGEALAQRIERGLRPGGPASGPRVH